MKALSIRQPWAWLIIHGGKNIENRNWNTKFRGRILIHAAKAFTKSDYENARFIAGRTGVTAFPSKDFLRMQSGGIIGTVDLIDCVKTSKSPWFFGEYGFVLENPMAMEFQPAKGRLGFFIPEIDK